MLRSMNKQLYLPVFLAIGSLLFVILSILVLVSFINLSMTQSFVLAYVFLSFFALFVHLNKRINRLSMGMMVLYYTVIQGIGIPLAHLLDSEYVYIYLNRAKVFYGNYMDKYVALTVLAVSVVIFSIAISYNKRQKNGLYHVQEQMFGESIKAIDNCYYEVGAFFVTAFALYMVINLIMGNIPLHNYLDYKLWSDNQMRNYLQILYWIGIVLICSAGSKKNIIRASIIAIIPAFILIITGNRNDVIIPLTIGVGLYVYRFLKLPKLLISAIIVFILIISPTIASSRGNGVTFKIEDSILTTMAGSLCELGGQLTPISNMFSWLEQGESYAYGMTFVYSSAAYIFGMVLPEFRQAYYASQYALSARLPTLAFTMSGELYFNFGIIGVIIAYFFLGKSMIRVESYRGDVDYLVKHGFFMFLMMFLVRNQVEFSLVYVIIFYIIYFTEKLLRENFPKRRRYLSTVGTRKFQYSQNVAGVEGDHKIE